MKKILPKISETERVALEAGVTWVDRELFSGSPDIQKLMKEPYCNLSPEEKQFLEGPVEKICQKINDWDLWKSKELPEDVMELLKKEGFFGVDDP